MARSVLLAGALTVLIAAPAWAADILIYGSADSTESGVATGGGHTVTIADDTQWAALTTSDFATFDAIVIGDGGCTDPSPILDAATANRATWSAAITGPIVIHSWDPGAHDDGAGPNQTDELTLNSINFASSGTSTGLYFTLGCYFDDNALTAVTILDQFGVFTVNDVSTNIITILDPTHPVMTGLTEAGLGSWGSSTHEQFVAFPASFTAIANGDDDDGLVLPVMVVRAAVAAPTPAASLADAATAPSQTGSPAALAALIVLLGAALIIGIQVRRRGVTRQG